MRYAVLLIGFILPIPLGYAPELDPWAMVIYIPSEQSLHWLSAEGVVDTLPITPEPNVIGDAHNPGNRFAPSPDGRFLAYAATSGSPDNMAVYLADLANRTCCTVLFEPEISPGMNHGYSVGAFSPDSTQLMVEYAVGDPADAGASLDYYGWQRGYLLVDVPSSTYTDLTSPTLFPDRQLMTWDVRGILLKEYCNGQNCGGQDNPPNYWMWQPATGEVSPYRVNRFISAPETLTSGESIQTVLLGQSADSFTGGVIYSNGTDRYAIYADDFKIGLWLNLEAHWVVDGQFVYLRDGFFSPFDRFDGNARLISRNGRQIDVEILHPKDRGDVGFSWIASTPDGWLMSAGPNSYLWGIIRHYRWRENDTFEITDLTDSLPEFEIVRSPVLGNAAADASPFVRVDAPAEYFAAQPE